MFEILIEIAKISPVIGLLIVGIWYFIKKEKGYKLEISNLNEELRNSEKENLTALYKITAFLQKLNEGNDVKNDIIIKDIENTKNVIIEKINNIK